MALGGTYQDHYKDMFKDVILHEAQQNGSRLAQTVMTEMMEGNKTYFQKMGKATHYIKTSRGELKQHSDATFERRQAQEVFASWDHILDKEDLIKYVSNPRNELVQSAVWELGRRKDDVILQALKGNAVVTTNGSTTNQALTQTVAVNDHTYDSTTGDVALTTSKLKVALKQIKESYGDAGSRSIFCVAPAAQIMNLTTENQQVSGDFRSGRPLEGPGISQALSGFLGITFIEYEETGTDGSSDELVYVFTDDAVKLGIYDPLTVKIGPDPTRVGDPDVISTTEAIGATRMYEEKVVEIACDPL
jgi:hypothetical protein